MIDWQLFWLSGIYFFEYGWVHAAMVLHSAPSVSPGGAKCRMRPGYWCPFKSIVVGFKRGNDRD